MKGDFLKAMKTMKKLIPALAMLLVSAVLLGTSTFAWFSMNNTVTVTGMEVKTVVSNNLLVDNYTKVDTSPKDGQWSVDDTTFESSKTQSITTGNVVVPVSTVDGINYYFTAKDNVKGDGDAKADSYTAVGADFAALKAAYTEADAGYLEYHFVLKANNTSASDAQKIILTQLDLTYNGTTDTNKAFRVAVLARKFATATPNGAKTAPGLAAGEGLITKIYAPTGATNFTDGQAVSGTSATSAVTYGSTVADSEIATVAANSTEYYEVAVRLWLEGEDTTCKVETFKGLTSGLWSFEIGFTLQSNTTGGVYVLNMATTPAP